MYLVGNSLEALNLMYPPIIPVWRGSSHRYHSVGLSFSRGKFSLPGVSLLPSSLEARNYLHVGIWIIIHANFACEILQFVVVDVVVL